MGWAGVVKEEIEGIIIDILFPQKNTEICIWLCLLGMESGIIKPENNRTSKFKMVERGMNSNLIKPEKKEG